MSDARAHDSASPRAVAVYVHVPFCRARCPFCGSYSVVGALERRGDFVAAAVAEWRLVLAEELAAPASFRVASLLIGGGTASLLGSAGLVEMLRRLRSHGEWQDDCAISIDVNPEDGRPELFAALKAAGCGRISIGVQSFVAAELQELGRLHTAERARAALAAAREAGVENLSVELMFGIPGQSPQSWEATLREAIAGGAQHLGCHPLTRGETILLARLLRADYQATELGERSLLQYQRAQEICAETGFEFYEVRHAARPGFRSRHHEMVWNREPSFGLGPGAHSFDGRRRWCTVADLDAYLNSLLVRGRRPARDTYRLAREDEVREVVYLGLRRAAGMAWAELARSAGPSEMARLQKKARFLAAQGFLALDAHGVRLEPQAYYVADSVSRELLFALSGGGA